MVVCWTWLFLSKRDFNLSWNGNPTTLIHPEMMYTITTTVNNQEEVIINLRGKHGMIPLQNAVLSLSSHLEDIQIVFNYYRIHYYPFKTGICVLFKRLTTVIRKAEV